MYTIIYNIIYIYIYTYRTYIYIPWPSLDKSFLGVQWVQAFGFFSCRSCCFNRNPCEIPRNISRHLENDDLLSFGRPNMRNPMVIQVHPQTSRCRVHTSWCVLIIIISAFSQGTRQQQTCFYQPCFARNCCLYRPRTFCMVRMDSWYPAMPLWQLREVALQTPIKSSSVQQLLVKMLKAYASPSFRVSRSSMYIWSLGLTLNINKPLAVVEPASLQKPSTKYCPANTNSSRSLAEIHVPLSWRIRKKLFTWVVANLSTSSSMSPCRSWRKHILMEVISSFETRTPLYIPLKKWWCYIPQLFQAHEYED